MVLERWAFDAGEDLSRLFLTHAGGQGLAMGGVDPGEVIGDLLRRFVFSKDDFGSALTKFAMEVEGGVAQLFERKLC